MVLIGMALVALPLVYFVFNGVSWQLLNPHEHIIQNGLTYPFLLLFSYYKHTLFVPRWFLNKQYLRYAIVAVSCVLLAAYLPIELSSGSILNHRPRVHSQPGPGRYFGRK